MNQNIAMVDLALDRYVASMRSKGIDPDGVKAKTLAALIGASRGTMSNALQDYRVQQQFGATRYVVGSRHYGRSGRWHILAKPGSDPQVVQQARAEQAMWAAADSARRMSRDIIYEVEPGLQGTALDQAIAAVLPFVTAQHEALTAFVRQHLANSGLVSTP